MFSVLSRQGRPGIHIPSLRTFSFPKLVSHLPLGTVPIRRSSSSIKASFAKGPVEGNIVERKYGSRTVLKMFGKHLWPKNSPNLRTRVVVALTLLVGSKLVIVQVPWLFKQIVDGLSIGGPEILVFPLAALLGYGVARASASLFQELRDATFAKVTQNAIREISGNTFYHLLKMDLQFHLSRDTGGLSRAIDRGTRAISFVMFSLLFNIVPTIIEISLVCGIMIYSFGMGYAGVTLVTLALYTTFTLTITQWRNKLRREMNKFDNMAGSVSVDALINFETVKYFNNEKLELIRYDDIMKQYSKSAITVQQTLSVLNFGQNCIFSIALTVVMMMASTDIVSGTLTIGDLVMINGLLFQLSMPLNFLGTVYRELRQALIDMDLLFSMTQLKSNTSNDPDAKDLVLSTGGTIEFKEVSFHYDIEKTILNKISFVVPAGKMVAIVGTSGGGKTTLFRLLYRFYDPESGQILIDGQDIKKVTLESLRKHIAVVPQDLVLFNETIRYNIAYGNPGASMEMIEKCSRLAHIHDAIMKMPKGYDTDVGERGLKLSGGEKQRICLARALMKEPKILLLDEITSGLDAESESIVQSAFGEITKGRTVFIISHRLKTVQSADRILVFDKGAIVEEGTHDQLYSNPNGVYHGLVKMQSLKV